MEWFVLFLVGLIYSFSAYITYTESRDKWWAIPVGTLLGAIVAILWFTMARYLEDKHRIYVYSLFWDTTMWVVYYTIPLLFFGVKLDRWLVVGLSLIITGMVVIKIRG